VNFSLPEKIEDLLAKLPERTAEKIKKAAYDPNNWQTLGLWSSAFGAAFIAVIYAKLFRQAEILFASITADFGAFPFLISPIAFVIAWWLVHRYAPEAAGSGIPQIMAANEIEYKGDLRPRVDRLLSLKTAAVKTLSSLMCVIGGGAIGREGPTLQISTSIFHFFGNRVRKFAPNTSEQTWVVAGAAAGLAAAFNTPLGGIVYAIEELGLVHFHKIRTALISAVIVSGLVAQWMLGSYLYLGFPDLAPEGISMVFVAILNGAVTGLAGALFGALLFYLLKKRLAIKKFSSLVAITAFTGLLMAALTYYDRRAAGSGVHVISSFLFDHQRAPIELVGVRFFGTMVSYLSGAAGGIFSPSLAIGATIGSFLGRFVASDHPNLMVLLGMIGFLTGVTRTPFTSFILVLEMTDRHVAIFPMMVTALAAQSAARLINGHSFYEAVKNRYLPPAPEPPPHAPAATPATVT